MVFLRKHVIDFIISVFLVHRCICLFFSLLILYILISRSVITSGRSRCTSGETIKCPPLFARGSWKQSKYTILSAFHKDIPRHGVKAKIAELMTSIYLFHSKSIFSYFVLKFSVQKLVFSKKNFSTFYIENKTLNASKVFFIIIYKIQNITK